ncbi:small, acid-soluble spore protein, H family [Clostridium sp. MB40-C1]|uniref:small, acid-soluble spore protein, H family n=1 Tax=Clostridium sp. MB40-C1 TaxID=3070996 RepID=UPI0027E19393|nr:small, acid-soluble spore protein, H family [Clostridium sp. MB40-C1]WMJ80462.1 small, acid-soluble spore protein, H family [Clostridium sp. MB40-C1]
MDMKRLNEIITNNEKVKILYEGHPVWIERIDNDAKTVQVRILDTQEVKGVYVKELVNTEDAVTMKY